MLSTWKRNINLFYLKTSAINHIRQSHTRLIYKLFNTSWITKQSHLQKNHFHVERSSKRKNFQFSIGPNFFPTGPKVTRVIGPRFIPYCSTRIRRQSLQSKDIKRAVTGRTSPSLLIESFRMFEKQNGDVKNCWRPGPAVT